MKPPHSRLILLGCLLALVVFPAAARADSLVFVRDNNVWLSNANAGGQYQVTLDGTASSPYESPSQADDGTIVAIRQPPGQRRQLFRMTQSGALLNAPINTPAPGTGALDAKVSPDGRLVAYWFVGYAKDPLCLFCVTLSNQVLLSYADRFTRFDEIGAPHTGAMPSWMSNDTLMMSNGSANILYYRTGMAEADTWFYDGLLFPREDHQPTLTDGEVSRDGRIAVVRGDNQETILLARTNGAPPARPTTSGCLYINPTGKFADPTWSNDGGTLAWQEDDGIWQASIGDVTDCRQISPLATLVVSGGTHPDLGPAPVNPGPRPGCGNPGNPAPCAQTNNGNGNGTGHGDPGNPPPSLSATLGRAGRLPKLRAALRSGIVFRVASNRAGTAQIKLLARRKVVARGSAKLAAPGAVKVKARFTAAAKRALKRRHRVTLTARLTVTDTAGHAVAKSTRLVLGR